MTYFSFLETILGAFGLIKGLVLLTQCTHSQCVCGNYSNVLIFCSRKERLGYLEAKDSYIDSNKFIFYLSKLYNPKNIQ